MKIRTPLPNLSEAEKVRRLAEMGLGPDRLPLTLTPAERQAAGGLEPNMEPITTPEPAPAPLVPAGVAKILGVIAGLLGTAGLVLPSLPFAIPAAVTFGVFALAAICAFLAGLALPGLTPDRPLLSTGAAVTAMSVAAALVNLAAALPEGVLKSGVLLVAALCAGLAGKALPQPTK
jgi:hypothetical protein